MKLTIAGAPHTPHQRSVHQIMRDVLLALIPGIIAHWWFFGWGIVLQLALAIPVALLLEAAALKVRNRPLQPFMQDLSAPVTAVLLCLSIPPLLPWWATVIGLFFAIIVAKHVYGGLGFNPFNPAMVGVAVILIAFPMEYSHWITPETLRATTLSLSDSAQAIFSGQLAITWDSISQATPLDVIRQGVANGQMIEEVRQAEIFGDYGGRGWEWIANFYILGGLYLLWRRVITWHTPVAMLAAIMLLSWPMYAFDPHNNPMPLQHIFSGAIVLGAFFIATDPVSGCTSNKGRLIFGAGVAIIALLIRRWGAYPDGVAFAVLLMNLAAPWIDQYTRPSVYGT